VFRGIVGGVVVVLLLRVWIGGAWPETMWKGGVNGGWGLRWRCVVVLFRWWWGCEEVEAAVGVLLEVALVFKCSGAGGFSRVLVWGFGSGGGLAVVVFG
jgi:hypothetical protein